MWLRALRVRSLAPSSSRLPWNPRPSLHPHAYAYASLRLYSDATPTPKSTPPPPITKVEKIVLDSIKATGPLPFALYMQLCLTHPTHGYYTNPEHPVFGARGDFITSPEISQVFGELVGVWFMSQWYSAGKPPAVRLVELGPGRGTLMSDIVRVISRITSNLNPLRAIHLVETSRPLREQQAKVLTPRIPTGAALHWHDVLEELPPAPGVYTMLVAHEFFDALPVHVLQKTQQGWNEVLVASSLEPLRDPRRVQSVSDAGTEPPEPGPETIADLDTVYPRLRRVLSSTPSSISTLLGNMSPRFQKLPEGATIEVSPAAYRTARKIGEVISGVSRVDETEEKEKEKERGGCALIMDYGGAKVYGDSFRAFKNHQIVDVFQRPGECDLTTNVDFALLSEAIGDIAETHGPISQRAFLERMGLDVRVAGLTRGVEGERKEALVAAAQRLVDPLGMGTEYQVMGITAGNEGEDTKGTWPFVELEDK